MKQADRLMIKAKRLAAQAKGQLCFAMIELDHMDRWVPRVQIYTPTASLERRSSWAFLTPCNTMEEAVQTVHALANEYPNSEDITIIIDDIPEVMPDEKVEVIHGYGSPPSPLPCGEYGS